MDSRLRGNDAKRVNPMSSASKAWLQCDADVVWLTFNLMGEPSLLAEVADALAKRGWRNTEGWEGAFLYPKVEVRRTNAEIVRVAEYAGAICARCGVEVVNIDADTSLDIGQSEFVTVYRV